MCSTEYYIYVSIVKISKLISVNSRSIELFSSTSRNCLSEELNLQLDIEKISENGSIRFRSYRLNVLMSSPSSKCNP